MFPTVNQGKVSTAVTVGPKSLKRSYAFSSQGGLSGNWKAKISQSKHLESVLCHRTLRDIFPKFPRIVAALQLLPVRRVVSVIAVATVKGGQCWSQASSTTMSPPNS